MSIPLLSTKLNVPPASPTRVMRRRLWLKLDESQGRGCPLTVVCAPAGYGKTTLVSEWVSATSTPAVGAGADAVRFAWLTLDAADNDLARFLEYAVAAVQRIQPGLGKGLLTMLQSPRPIPPQLLATLLINDLAEVEPIALVLDDYHAINTQAIHEFVSFVLDHPTPQLRLVILTRADPPLPLARLRARGQLAELRLADLRFTADEAEQYLNQAVRLGLPSDGVTALLTRTEGWIAGLQLAALSLCNTEDATSFVAAFSGSYEHIADYLTGEVLAQQPQRVQSFLLQTSILDRFCGPLCAAVTGQADADELLRRLREANLFLVSLDPQREWYRYHTLFADLLRKRLYQTQGGSVAELHHRASCWYEQSGWVHEAIEHALVAQDADHAAELVERAAEAALMRGEADTVLRWLEVLPAESKEAHPLLWVFQGLALLLCARPAAAVQAHVKKAVAAGRAGFLGELNTVRSLAAVLEGRPAEAVALAEEALRSLTAGRPLFRSLAADSQGMAYALAGDTTAAAEAFEQAVDAAAQAGCAMIELTALSNLAGLRWLQGRLGTAGSLYQQVLQLATDRLGRDSTAAGKAWLGLGELARERNDLPGALRYLEEAVDSFRHWPDVGTALAYLAIYRVRLAQGNLEDAESCLEKAYQAARASSSTHIDDRLVESARVHLWIARGELEAAARWAQASGLLQRPITALIATAGQTAAANELVQSDYCALARLFLAQGRPGDAQQVLDPLLDAAEGAGNVRRVLVLLVLKALALQAQGETAGALQVLRRALTLGEAERFCRTFLDEGKPMAHLLYLALERGYSPGYVRILLQAFAAEPEPSPTMSAPHISCERQVEPLSQRELEVLAGIAEGLSNREIGARLYLSLSTVKWHTANIYGKLGVNSRTQAVSMGRRLGLLPLL